MKALIIDDNHSFIDLLKNALKPFRLQIDSYYRFSDARDVLLKNGCYFNQTLANEVLKYHESVVKNPEKNTAIPPVLNQPIVRPDGYALIFLEYDAESSIKGTHFIHDVLKNQREWTEKNFILLSSDPQKVEPLAKKMKIALIEKPIKKDYLLKLVADYINTIKQRENEVNQLIAKYGITVATEFLEPEKKPRKKATSDSKKTASKVSKAVKTNKPRTSKTTKSKSNS